MNRMQKLIDENMSLRNKIRQLESQYTSETYFYKNEFRTLQSTNSNLNSEIECLKDNYASLQVKFDEIKRENDNLNCELSVNTEKISNLIKQNKEIAEENNKIRLQTQEYENLHKELILNNEILTHQKSQLEFECNDLKRIVEESKSDRCNVSEHNNYDFIVKQNNVLQDLVKSMRTERKAFIKQNEEAESRLEKLELLMKLFKEGASQNYSGKLNIE
ncbi:hypothetical protein ILUMI_26368 [Ignelater luminosus]|uniref:Uncharacterized protein n=1 Tax=Ignelater luminosus TaxID=2038154 RepID=A0A8K0FZ03_IGNLU|nr:hypothetical protein ILUMI_26368 [Ignelater luminosus]